MSHGLEILLLVLGSLAMAIAGAMRCARENFDDWNQVGLLTSAIDALNQEPRK